MGSSGITKRWVWTTLAVIVVLLLVVVSSVFYGFSSYYYEYVRMTLESRASSSVTDYFSPYINGTDDTFKACAKDFAESFDDKELMEVWVIDKYGSVVVSSSGFAVGDMQMPDYTAALSQDSGGFGSWRGRLDTGEKVSALTMLLPEVDGKPAGAVRFLISMNDIDSQLITIAALVVFAFAFAIALVTISGMFFVRSIVRPVRVINETAKRIAEGDFAARIEERGYDDEISELGRTINNMANEIGAADRMKNDFISTISHELRTPLTAIKGWGETLIQVRGTDEALEKRGLEIITNESDRLSSLVEDLLDFSRMQNGKLSLRLEKIDVLAELDEAVFVFKERAARDGIELIYTAPDFPAPMQGDVNRIKQVFVNILDNSMKYTEQGGKVAIVAEIDSDRLIIEISDTGCGIPQSDIPKVKEKFFKGNMSVPGTGIGLAVADEIIRMHGGSIDIYSEVGVGTTVTITLPIESVVLPEERLIQDE
ncbi:MAG: HAMP domain-containing histidine kinase [Clostridiales bacterium]|nr:HAMP domain-containing histidine kinase [Clostridiales bacterium]